MMKPHFVIKKAFELFSFEWNFFWKWKNKNCTL